MQDPDGAGLNRKVLTVPRQKPPPKTHDRTRGEGSVVEVTPGVFRAWRPPGEDGKRLSKRFSSHAAAHRWLVGEPEPEILYVGPFLERWLELRSPILRGRSVQTYMQFLGYAGDGPAPIAAIPLADLTADDCQAWLNGLLASHTRYAVKVTKGIMSSAFKSAVPQYLAVNPIAATRLPKPEERKARAWRRDEVTRLLLAGVGSPHAICLAFAIGTGLRFGELRALEWTDLDLQAMTVRVSKSLDNKTNAEGPTKTDRSRIVDVPEELRAQLVEHKARQRAGDRYVFGRDGRPYTSTAFRQWLRRLCLRAGVHDARKRSLGVHSTRHTFASLALADPECHIPDVSHALGHASMATTLNVYGHFIDHERRRTARALGRVLASVTGDLHRDLHRSDAATR